MEPTSTTIKAGTMLATGGLVADAVIFSDISYLYLAIVGAFVSAFGVLHEIYGVHSRTYSGGETVVEIIKGIALGLLAIPFWYLILTGIGNKLLINYFEISFDLSIFTSLSLLIAFGLSWFTVPIFDFTAKTIPKYIVTLLDKAK